MQFLFMSQLHDLYIQLPWVAAHRGKQARRAIDEQKRRIYPKEKIEAESALVCERLEKSVHFQQAKVIMAYFPVHNEVDILPLIRKYKNEKTFLFPALTHGSHKMKARVFHPHTPFQKNRFGIPEPDTEEYTGTIDMILVPGISFDKKRWRIGRGGAYYDRFLKKYRRSFKVGICYDFQLHEDVPHWIKDVRMDRVVTPTTIIR